GEAGFTPDEITTDCTVTLGDGVITESHLELKAKVPGISREQLVELATNAKNTCPISQALSAVEIVLEISLAN
ncbi:MAG: OsmC family protein, partial [Bacteroidetes bacterium]|nr:OsmC family protein [Bacteroidota bacterium]